jgi:phosphatidylglycerol:prolipoprotein diacylglycerol transferase
MNEWFDPNILTVGPLQIRWYGAMYVLGFLIGGAILKYLADKKFWPLTKEAIDKYITWLIIGMFIGARIFYVVLYNWDYYSLNLMDIFAVWKGGLSFHGAVVGMTLATYFFARKNKVHFFEIADCMAIAGSPGLLCGRIGNFINGELYGRVTDSWLGVVFPDGGPFPRHASQLYEGLLEGVVLFIILFYAHKRERFYGVVTAGFLLGYGIFRFIVEFFREPDAQLGYYLGYFTMGQLLCLVMVFLSFVVLRIAKKLNIKTPFVKA